MNYYLIVPSSKEKELNFRFTGDKQSIYSEISFAQNTPLAPVYCSNCLYLEKYSYRVSLNLEIANRKNSDKSDNYEAEVKFIQDNGEVRNIKRIFYLDWYDENIIELASKLMSLPFRMLGFFNTQKVELVITEEYDNYIEPLERMEVIIHSKTLNIKNGKVNIIPKIGWAHIILSYARLFTLPLLFFFLIFSQVVVFIVLAYMYQKPTAIV